MSNHVKLGIFVAAVFVVFLAFTLNITKGYLLGGRETYFIYFKQIGTLETGAPVKQAGYNVGYVSEIKPADIIVGATPEKRILVTVSVKPTTEISVDSDALIYTAGLMGEMYVEISYGQERKLEPGNPQDFILGTPPFSMGELVDQVTELGNEIKETFDNVNTMIGTQQTRESFPKIVQNIEKLTGNLDDLIGGEKQTLSQMLENLRDASLHLKGTLAHANAVVTEASQMISENRTSLRRTFDNAEQITSAVRESVVVDVRGLSNRLQEVSDNINDVVVKVGDLVDKNEPAASETLTNLNNASLRAKEAADSLALMIEDIRGGKGVLGRLLSDEELGVRTESIIRDTGSMVREASTVISGETGLVKKAEEVVTTVRGVPDRFTLLYDASWYDERDRYGRDDDNNFRNDLIVRLDLSDTIFAEVGGNRIGDENEFNGMVGYRYGPWTARAGVFESEAGASLDVALFERFILGVRGAGLTEEDRERLDIYGSYRIWDGLSLIGGVEDLTDETYANVGLRLEY